MNPDDQELAWLRAAFAVPAGAAPAPESCPTPDTLWAAVRGELPPHQLREVLDHTASCAACAEDWRLAKELALPAAAAAAPGKLLQGRFGQWRPLAAAAALAAGLLIAVGIQTGRFAPDQPPAYRAGEQTEVRSLLPEGQALSRQVPVLRWTPLPGAASYNVQVSTEDLRVLASSEGQTTTDFRIPQDALAGLAPQTRLLWQVDAVFPDGHRVTSPTFGTTIQ